jgi:hypothetical protein
MTLRHALSALVLAAVATAAAAQPNDPPAASQPEPAPALTWKTHVANPEDLLDTQRTLIVPTAYVAVLVQGRVAATKQSGLFSGGNNSVGASASYRVAGLDKAYLQNLARAAHEDLVARLRQAGYTVLTWADVKDREVFRNAQRETTVGPLGLPTRTLGNDQYVVAAPSDEQHFKSALAGGDFAEFIQYGKAKITDATLILPQYTVMAPQAWAGGSSGYKSISAEANVAEGMNMVQAQAHWMGQPKSRMMRGAPGVTSYGHVKLADKVGSVAKTADTTSQGGNAIAGALGSLFGSGSVQRSSGEYLLTIDPALYAQTLLGGVRSFNAEVAKVAAEAKP